MIIRHDQNLYNIALEVIYDECEKFMNENPEVFTEHYKHIIYIGAVSQISSMFHSHFKFKEGNIPSEYVNKIFERYEHGVPYMQAWIPPSDPSLDVFKIKYIVIDIIHERICEDIIKNMYRLDEFFENIRNYVRHELGHVMWFISLDGKPNEFVEQDTESCEKEMDEHFKWVKENDDNLTTEEKLRRYHEIPSEALANDLGGVCIEDLIKFETSHSNSEVEINIVKKDTITENKV